MTNQASLSPSSPADPVKRAEPFSRSLQVMGEQLAEIMARPGGPFRRWPAQGFQRGIDYYTASNLVLLVAQGAHGYHKRHGAYPRLTNPETLTEKIFWSKFFRPLKVPEAGNKLEVASLVSNEARSLILIPQVVWRSATAELPASEAIAPGTYYLKTNHGSDMFRRIEWPLSDADRQGLETEFAGYLRNDFGYRNAEWWYLRFPREIFLERSVSSDPYPIAWYFYTFAGSVARIIAFRKAADDAHSFWLKPDFTPLETQSARRPLTQFALPSAAVRNQMLEAARAIGRRFSFVRVDFLLGDDDRLYLSELTFSPGNGQMRWPGEMDLELGSMWDLNSDSAA